ncbi:MAG: Rieske 2Fe-2S domain-containing protein [Saprospiraceae bacterium]|nr:Rieske 2Fe-2S domain-containing protein [Saprospiraceae bacterium]
MKKAHFSEEEYREIVRYVEQLTRDAEQLPWPQAKEFVFTLLRHFDYLHREPLARLFRRIRAEFPQLLEEIEADTTTRMLFGLYEMMDMPEDKPSTMAFIPEEAVGILSGKAEKWVEAEKLENIDGDQIAVCNVEGVSALLFRTGDRILAYRNACADTLLPLQTGSLEGHVLTCPWHGCEYDLRSGRAPGKNKELKSYETFVTADGTIKLKI